MSFSRSTRLQYRPIQTSRGRLGSGACPRGVCLCLLYPRTTSQCPSRIACPSKGAAVGFRLSAWLMRLGYQELRIDLANLHRICDCRPQSVSPALDTDKTDRYQYKAQELLGFPVVPARLLVEQPQKRQLSYES